MTKIAFASCISLETNDVQSEKWSLDAAHDGNVFAKSSIQAVIRSPAQITTRKRIIVRQRIGVV